MPCHLVSRPVLAALGLLLLGSSMAEAGLLGRRRYETAYIVPTASVLAVPTSYAVPSTYVLPTSYVVPTVYSSTALETSVLTPTYYLSPSSYVVPTSYVLPTTYRARPYVTRRYVPTVTTTVFEEPIVTSTSYAVADDCVTAPAVSESTVVRSNSNNGQSTIRSSPIRSTPSNGSAPERRPTPEIQSMPAEEPGLSSEVAPSAESTPPPASSVSPPAPSSLAPDFGLDPSPSTPIEANPPEEVAPPDLPLSADTIQREVRRPSYSPSDPAIRPASVSQGLLEGRVVSAISGRPEGNVRVILSDRRDRFTDRVQTTDALGRYAINLPEGDWTVKVEMPSRKVFPVSEVTVSGGRVSTTEDGRDVAILTIKR